jgi:pyruvate dehydrogenase E2 component (dihydrolipoamide acetyltransferase)
VAIEVKLPRLGQGMEAGTIVRWLKAEGDEVAKGEPLYELDTDKVTQEVEADAAGVLLKIVVPEGEANVGTTVGVIGAADEDVSELLSGAQGGNGGSPVARGEETQESEAEEAPPEEAEPEAKAEEAPSGSEPQGEDEAAAPAAPASAPASRPTRAEGEPIKASPLARRMARERGLDLAALTGTGPEGRIIAEDVEQAGDGAAPAVAAPEEAAPEPEPAEGEIEVVELTSIRRTIARRLTEAWEAPVFQLSVTADASQLASTRERMVELLREGETKPTVNDVLTRLVASALQRHPAVNALFVDGKIHRYRSVNVGIAVATPNGLVVPVIRDADRKSVLAIAADRADLVGRAREGKLQLPDLQDGTFTISNLGMYDIEQFIAVLNPPQVAILAVGSIEERPAAIEGTLEIRGTMTMTITCDHRAIDGSEGAEFLRTVKSLVESPALAL